MNALMKRTGTALRLLLIAMTLTAGQLFAQQEMTKDEWSRQMTEYKAKVTDLQAKVTALDADISALQSQNAKLDADVAACEDALYAMLGYDGTASLTTVNIADVFADPGMRAATRESLKKTLEKPATKTTVVMIIAVPTPVKARAPIVVRNLCTPS